MDYNTTSLATTPENNYSSETLTQNVSQAERAISVGLGAFLIYDGVKKLVRAPLQSISRGIIGYTLIQRGVTGHCNIYERMEIDGTKSTSVNIRTTFTVNKPREEVYAFWRKLENLPLFMKHLSKVEEIDRNRSHWEAKIPENNPVSIKWDAEIVKDEPGSLLSWQSLPGGTIENAGKVEFRDALGHQGTEVRVVISYRPPAGTIGTGVAKLLNPLFQNIVKKDIMNFKDYIEFRHEPTNGGSLYDPSTGTL